MLDKRRVGDDPCGLQTQSASDPVSDPLSSCVTLGELLNLSEPLCPICKTGIVTVTSITKVVRMNVKP